MINNHRCECLFLHSAHSPGKELFIAKYHTPSKVNKALLIPVWMPDKISEHNMLGEYLSVLETLESLENQCIGHNHTLLKTSIQGK